MPASRQPIVSVTRRHFLAAGGVAVVLAACDSGDTSDESAADEGSSTPTGASGSTPEPPSDLAADTALTAEDFDGLGTCVLIPEQSAGPFPLDEQFDRRDITEGVPGRPWRLGLRVVDGSCAPVPGAAVEIWHTDATGDYSAFDDGGDGKDEGPGTTFCRGTQTASDAGIVEFLTIVPGWYPGRAVHIHLRVRVDDDVVLTSQLYFDAADLAAVYAEAPYAEFGPPGTSNEADGLAGAPAADGTLVRLTDTETSAGPGSLGLLNLGVSA